jgi:hypothetical protein
MYRAVMLLCERTMAGAHNDVTSLASILLSSYYQERCKNNPLIRSVRRLCNGSIAGRVVAPWGGVPCFIGFISS